MVSAAEGRKLDRSFIATHRLQAGMTERQQLEVRGRCNRGATVPTTSGHGAAEPSEDSASHPRIVERGRFHVEANRQHATADVATDSLRIDQPRGCDHHADADVGRKMYIRHDGDLLDVPRASEALDRLRHVLLHWRGQPSLDGCERWLTHPHLHPGKLARTTAPAHACA